MLHMRFGSLALFWMATLCVAAPGCSRGGRAEYDPNDLGSESLDNGGAPEDAGKVDAGFLDGASGADLSQKLDLAPPNDDPFDPASCEGPALTAMQATTRLGANPRLKLADATLYRRTRSCTGMTPDTCGPFGAKVPHTQALLTYSGGVVTDYKTFSFPTHLILFAQAGQPKFSIRHESDYRHDANANTRGVVFAFGMTPLVNNYPVIYVWDFAPAPNRYQDLQGLLGDVGKLYASERCARVVFTTSVSVEVAALYRF